MYKFPCILFRHSANSSGYVASDVRINVNHMKEVVLTRLKKNSVTIVQELR